MNNQINSKFIVFGEYSVLAGSKSLAIPLNRFSGELTLSKHDEQFSSNKEIKNLYLYIKEYLSSDEFFKIDFDRLKLDIEKGLSFKSTIPQGYGLGSSGAVCAAIAHEYVDIDKHLLNKNQYLLELKLFLAQLEEYFHGKSSGVDPLISYLNKTVLIEGEKVSLINSLDFSNKGFFLIDTGKSRQTSHLVNIFVEKINNQVFKNLCEDELNQYTNNAIGNLMSNNLDALFSDFSKISSFQYKYFRPMIPKLFEKAWSTGLESDYFKIKLCGAGGGGYLLGYTKDIDRFRSENKNLTFLSL